MLFLALVLLVGPASAASLRLASRATSTWTYQGCYLDGVGQRTFTHPSYTDYSVQTIGTCTSYCGANGYNYAGLEYGTECYCDVSLSGATQQPESDCSMPCAGNSSQVCGNGNRLSIYFNGQSKVAPSTNPGPSGWSFLACYADSAGARTLTTGASTASSGLTVAQCATACKSGGYTLAGVEYGSECYCDTMIRNSASIASSGCDTLCAGNRSEYCGGSNRIGVYQLDAATTPPTSGGSLPTGWKSLGCYTDNGGARTLGTQNEVPGGYTNMTVSGCLAVCSSLGYPFGGLEYAQECFCGGAILNGGACASDQSTCYQPCRGNTAEVCGGPNRLNLYYAGSNASVVACSAVSSSSSAAVSSTSTTTLSISSSTSSISTTSTSSAVTTSSTTSSTTTSTSPTSTVCPTFWSAIIADLAPAMRVNGQCTDLARAAIRYAFHDAGGYSSKTPPYAPASGGADGSLLLSTAEIDRPDNDGLHDYHSTLTQKLFTYRSAGYTLSAADLIQVSGALGVLACPGGRTGRVFVGRSDTTVAAPEGLLPAAFGAGSDHNTILQLFVDKGFSARDLAALLGAHSTSKANFQTRNGLPAGVPQDSTPGVWDVNYYNETYNPPSGIGRFDSDINLSKDKTSAVGKQFSSFVGATGAWAASFSSAYQALSLLGVPSAVRAKMQDCTIVVNAAYS